MSDLMASLAHLTPAEKLNLIGELWDDLSANPANISLTPTQLEELNRRKKNLEDNPKSALTWDEIVTRIREKHAS